MTTMAGGPDARENSAGSRCRARRWMEEVVVVVVLCKGLSR